MVYDETEEGGVREMIMSRTRVVVRDGLVSSFKGIHEIEAEIVSLVRHTVAKDCKSTGRKAVPDILQRIITGALQAMRESGAGGIFSIKSVVKGAVPGVSDVCGDVHTAAYQAVALAVSGAKNMETDVAIVTRRAVQGVIEAANETCRNVDTLSQAAIAGALAQRLQSDTAFFLVQQSYGESLGREIGAWRSQMTL